MTAKFKLADQKELGFKDYVKVWKTGTFEAEDGMIHKVEMADALSHPSSTQFFPVTVETMVREAIEPMMIGSQLLEQIQYTPGLQMTTFPSTGAITADDVNEAGEYPEYTLNFAPGHQIITIGKSGIACKFTEELLRYSQYDVLGMYLKAMGRALVRHKESKIWNMFSAMGIVTHDNDNPGTGNDGVVRTSAASGSMFGTTTGYGEDGTFNGSVTIDDIYEAYGALLMNGYTPNALIVHPLTFTAFLTDPVMRSFALSHSGPWMNGWNGNAQVQNPWNQGIMGKMGPGTQAFDPTAVTTAAAAIDFPQNAKMKTPDYWGLGQLQIIVSPFVPYNASTKVTDVYLVDTNNIGALITDELPTMDTMEDKYRDITKIKIRERYAIAPFNDGNAIAVMKGVRAIPAKLHAPTAMTGPAYTADSRSTDVDT